MTFLPTIVNEGRLEDSSDFEKTIIEGIRGRSAVDIHLVFGGGDAVPLNVKLKRTAERKGGEPG